jgi:hypothetical protein
MFFVKIPAKAGRRFHAGNAGRCERDEKVALAAIELAKAVAAKGEK